ncbi:uncharacterized protein LOC108914314 [Anoplophora glabripennis]|uniref:uncharacterized protein LOC108914314 n=1 Tax=Anoplophora glabripennis TaxID=217634 RepID=UPI000875A433|nr:uncharacterized protein LOC108914314 [Anoplophora glabripennis]
MSTEFTEKLIKIIKKYPVLFDLSHPDYKNVRVKNKVWNEISKKLNLGTTGGNDLKKRWKNLRDCYSKYLRSKKTRTGQQAKSICRYKSWPWAQHMEAFRPFLQFGHTEFNISDLGAEPSPEAGAEETDTSNVQSEITKIEILPFEINNTQEKHQEKTLYTKRKRPEQPKSQTTFVDKVINFLEKHQHKNTESSPDEIDLMFQGYAASVKKLSIRRQTLVKYKIAKLIMEEELAQQAEAETQAENLAGSSFSVDSSALSSSTINKIDK